MTNGCICCSMAADLVKTVEEILENFNPLHLFIEATGVADPLEVLLSLKGEKIESRVKVPKVVTVLDGDLWEGREFFGPLFYNQIKGADLLLFNKIDLLFGRYRNRSQNGNNLRDHHSRSVSERESRLFAKIIGFPIKAFGDDEKLAVFLGCPSCCPKQGPDLPLMIHPPS